MLKHLRSGGGCCDLIILEMGTRGKVASGQAGSSLRHPTKCHILTNCQYSAYISHLSIMQGLFQSNKDTWGCNLHDDIGAFDIQIIG